MKSEPYYLVTFQNRACIRPLSGYRYLTCNTLIAHVQNDTISVPAPFDTDLASIPRWLWPVLAPTYSDFIYPAILHDYLYTCPGNTPRRVIDDIFYSALVSQGVTPFTASKMWAAVRIFGAWHFNEGETCDEPFALYGE